MTLTLIHNNSAFIANDQLRIDRKFLTGMKNYVAHVPHQIVSLHPATGSDAETIDSIEVPLSSLGFRVETIATNAAYEPTPQATQQLHALIADSTLVCGSGFGAIEAAQRQGKPFVLVLECDLATQIAVATMAVNNPLRRMIRRLRITLDYFRRQVPEMRAARAIHCNGYPVFDAASKLNANCMLYLDSRMSREMVITEELLEARLRERPGRPIRLIYSGRYEPLKGALDAVACALTCLQRGLPIEFDCYGSGVLLTRMRDLVKRAGAEDRVRVHDAIPFPELVERSRQADIFVCCHRQHDPSCTYLESFGAGLAIVGYDNRMWSRMCETSQAGLQSPVGNVSQLADRVATLVGDPGRLDEMSRKARTFALEHSFEDEFKRRTDALNAELRAITNARG